MDIYLIRHTPVNVEEGVCYGFSDVDIMENHNTDFKEIKQKLCDLKNAKIYSSPSKRCKLLASHLSETDPTMDERIKELNFGDWEMKKWTDIDEEKAKAWGDNFVTTPTPNGEAYIDLHKRALLFFNELLKNDTETAIVVTHGGVIRSILSYIMDFPLENSFKLQIDYSSVTKIVFNNGRFQISYINR